MNQASSTPRQPQVIRQLDELAKNISILEEVIICTEERLKPILSDNNTPELGESSKVVEESLTDVASVIRTNSNNIFRIYKKVSSILDRIEI